MTTEEPLTGFLFYYIICKDLQHKVNDCNDDEFGQQNLFAKEPQMVVESYNRKGLESPTSNIAETYNGRWAMMGIVSGFISYAFTGNFFFGIF